jgi:hypothetical protein
MSAAERGFLALAMMSLCSTTVLSLEEQGARAFCRALSWTTYLSVASKKFPPALAARREL